MTESRAKRKRPFQISYGEYLADTMHLSTEQHGAYLLLLMELHHNGCLPTEDHRLARVAVLPLAKWRAMQTTIMKLINEKTGARS